MHHSFSHHETRVEVRPTTSHLLTFRHSGHEISIPLLAVLPVLRKCRVRQVWGCSGVVFANALQITGQMEDIGMRKFIAALSLLLASCFIVGNVKSQPQDELKTVTAGDLVTFKVQLDPVPQFSGGVVSVLIGPISRDHPDEIALSGGHLTRTGNIETVVNQSSYELSVRVPGDAPNGVWQAFFSFALPNGGSRPLYHSQQKFRVKEQTYSGVPRYALITRE